MLALRNQGGQNQPLDLRRTLPRLRMPVLSADQRFFAGVDAEGRAVWGSVGAPDRVAPVPQCGPGQTRVALSAVGSLFAAADSSGPLRIWRRGEGSIHASQKAHTIGVHHVTFAEHGHLLLSVGDDRWVKTWSTDLQLLRAWKYPAECWLWIG